MKQLAEKAHTIPLVGSACVLLAAVAAGHPVLGLVGALTVYQGLAWRRHKERRVAGTALAAVGALFVVGLVLFSTGYKTGKFLAERDNSQVVAPQPSGPDA